MDSIILWALIAFLLVDILLIILVVRGGRKAIRPGGVRTTVRQAPVETADISVPNATIPQQNLAEAPPLDTRSPDRIPAKGNLSRHDSTTFPAGEHAENQQQFPEVVQDGGDNEQLVWLSVERGYLRQRANTLEERLAALNDAPDATTDYRRGMKAILEEELHAAWARLSELDAEESRVNHMVSK